MGKLRRRRFIVNNFQKRLLLAALLHFTIVVLVSVLVVFIPLTDQLQDSGLDDAQQQAMVSQFLSVRANMLRALAALALILAIHSMFISHRAAGPMVRIRQILLSVARGDMTERANLRKNDYLRDEADVVNNMMESLNEGLGTMQNKYRLASASLAALRRSEPEHNAQVQELATRMEDLGQSLSQFKTTTQAPAESSEAPKDVPQPV